MVRICVRLSSLVFQIKRGVRFTKSVSSTKMSHCQAIKQKLTKTAGSRRASEGRDNEIMSRLPCAEGMDSND